MNQMRLSLCVAGLTALVVSAGSVIHAGNWPSFQNGGSVSQAEGTPFESLTIDWSIDLIGVGQSSPVVWDDHVYITSVSGDNKEVYHVAAYQYSDGSVLWQHELPNASPMENSDYVSKAAPTPAADENGVIAFFEGGNLIALTHGGDMRWERNLVEEYGAIDARHGLSASLEQSESAVFVWMERTTEPYVMAVDKQTGDDLWKVPGLATTSWASPRLLEVEGGEHLVLSGVGTIVGLDPASGERIWEMTGISGNSTPTPMPQGEGKFLIGATVGRGESEGGNAAESNGLIAVTKADDGTWSADYVWRAENATSSFGSPIQYEDRAYYVNRTGVLFCLDANTGAEVYTERVGNSIWATPIASGDRLMLFGNDGVIRTFAAGDTFAEDTELNIFEGAESEAETAPTLYAAVLIEDAILIRSGSNLYRLSGSE
jgi:outer membrane protein assembly factor BamB